MPTGGAAVEVSGKDSWKGSIRTTLWPCSIPARYILRGPCGNDSCMSMFIADLITIARKWSQPVCPPADEWIMKTGCLCKKKRKKLWNLQENGCSWNYWVRWRRARKTKSVWFLSCVDPSFEFGVVYLNVDECRATTKPQMTLSHPHHGRAHGHPWNDVIITNRDSHVTWLVSMSFYNLVL